MDQDSAPGGKSSWRDRLGIPKDEAGNTDGQAGNKPVPEATRMAPRAPMSPAAPMAPGASRPGASNPMAPRAPMPPARPAPLASRSEVGAPPRSSASEGLAERLRQQREAAERLAEQRLALARQRAANRVNEAQAQAQAQAPTVAKIAAPNPATSAAPRAPIAPPPAPARPAAPVAAQTPAASAPSAPVQPRFSFAEEINRAKRAPIAPARPASLPPLRPSNTPLAAPSAGSRAEPRLDGAHNGLSPLAPRPPLRPRIDETKTDRSFAGDFKDDFEDDFLEPDSASDGARGPTVRAPVPLAAARGEQGGSQGETYFTAQRLAVVDKEAPARKGPLLLLGSLLGLIVLFAFGIFIWQQMPSETATAPVEAEVPVVSAPAEPVKMEPEPEAPATEAATEAATGKKQIYDRILGDEEQGGVPENIVPSEEEPVPQDAATDSLIPTPEETPGLEPPAAEPPSDDLLPIPAEPEPSGQNGSLDAQQPDQFAATTLPVPAETQMAETPPPTPAEPADVAAVETPAVEIPGVDTTAPATPGPVSLVVTPRPKPAKLAAKPVAPALPPEAPATEQVASVDTPSPVPVATAYVAQLSSLNSEADAKAEFSRVRSAHSAIVGSLSSVITKADLGTRGTIFRLALGPLASKDAASKLCAQLIAAGEKDCIVRRQ